MVTDPHAAPGWLPRPSLLLAVAVGGAIGTGGRHLVAETWTRADGWPIETLLVNLVGSFVLGLLLEVLATRRHTVVTERVRAGLGSGVLGGFTTYSAFAVETERMLADGQLATAGAYVGASLVGGLVAAVAGIVLGGALAARWTRGTS